MPRRPTPPSHLDTIRTSWEALCLSSAVFGAMVFVCWLLAYVFGG